MKQHMVVLWVLGMLPWAGLNAQQTASTTLRVTATVEESCDVTAPDLPLGNYTAQSRAPLRATILLSVTCTPNATYNVGLRKGTSPGATINRLSGNTIGTDTLTGVGTGLEVDHTVFGGVPATQTLRTGDYADTITVRFDL